MKYLKDILNEFTEPGTKYLDDIEDELRKYFLGLYPTPKDESTVEGASYNQGIKDYQFNIATGAGHKLPSKDSVNEYSDSNQPKRFSGEK